MEKMQSLMAHSDNTKESVNFQELFSTEGEDLSEEQLFIIQTGFQKAFDKIKKT